MRTKLRRTRNARAIAVVGFVAACLLLLTSHGAFAAITPNVLMIVVDDMNDWISLLDAKSPIQTPNLERLAARGTLFTHAYCMSPACNPSRAATLTGLRPTTTGVYGNKSDWRRASPERKTIFQRFADAGYRVRGAGKIFHHHLNGAFHDAGSFHDFQHMRPQLYPSRKLNGAPKYGSRNTDWGVWPPTESDSIDFQTTNYAVETLRTWEAKQPLFLAVGIFKPHSPFFAPLKYHTANKNIGAPERATNDMADLPTGAHKLMKSKRWFWQGMQRIEDTKPGSYLEFVRSYAACIRFADAQIGRILDALDQSNMSDNTIVVLWSDHGFHLGEKEHIEKFALWEKSNHIPFLVVAPNVTQPGSKCNQPIDMSTLYPTLLDLAGLAADPSCDGQSIVPLLRSPKSKWSQPAIMTYLPGNHAVRSARWRYIRYADGTEELYDHDADPNEWRNVADITSRQDVLAAHRAWLPKSEASQVADLTSTK